MRLSLARFKKHLPHVLAIFFLSLSSSAIGASQSNPWLMLLLNNDQQGETKRITEAGGVVTFRNGLILDVPAGAVLGPTDITVKDVPCLMVNPILSSFPFTSHKKRCIGGFSGEPEGLVFNEPIRATVPVSSFEPGEFPVQFEANLNEQSYWIAATDLDYDGVANTIDLTIQHFSDYWLAVMKNHIDEVCSHCATWNDPVFAPTCESLDSLQPACCLLIPSERERCAPGCQCCREKRAKVRAAGMDSSYGECQIVGDEVEVTFPECPGSPTEKYSISEASTECPKILCNDISGSWSGSWSETNCDGEQYSGSWAAEVTVDCVFKGTGAWDHKRGTVNPFTMVLASQGTSVDGCGFFSLTGVFSSNSSLSGSYSYTEGGGGSFSGHK